MEAFRSEFKTGMVMNIPSLTAEQINDVLGVFDVLTHDKYDMVAKTTALVLSTGYNAHVVQQYLATYYTRRKSEGTIQNAKYFLTNFFEAIGKDANTVDTADILNFFLTYRAGKEGRIAPSTQAHYEQIIDCFYKWAVKNNRITGITENPMVCYERATVPATHKQAMTNEEVARLLDACEDERERLICEFLLESGCRVAELCKGRRTDLRGDLEKDGEVPYMVNGKGNKDDIYFISSDLYNRIKNFWASSESSEYILTNSLNEQLTPQTVRRTIHRIQDSSGLGRITITPHTFRHTAATHLVSNCGGTSYDVKLLLNHSSATVSERYIDQDLERRRKVAVMARNFG